MKLEEIETKMREIRVAKFEHECAEAELSVAQKATEEAERKAADASTRHRQLRSELMRMADEYQDDQPKPEAP
jgi:hypothetical protein